MNKNREGIGIAPITHPQNIKIWVNVNLGTGEVKDCWTTTWDNKPYKLKPMRLERNE